VRRPIAVLSDENVRRPRPSECRPPKRQIRKWETAGQRYIIVVWPILTQQMGYERKIFIRELIPKDREKRKHFESFTRNTARV
jgi:hypothetical protein